MCHHAVDDVRCLWVVARVQGAEPRHQLVDGHALRVAAAVDLEDWRVRRQVAALGPAVSQSVGHYHTPSREHMVHTGDLALTSPGTAGSSGPASREECRRRRRGASRHPLAARRIDRSAVGLLEVGLFERHAPFRKQQPDSLGLASGGPVVERRPTTQREGAAAQAPEVAGEAQAETKADGEPELVPEGVRYRAEGHVVDRLTGEPAPDG